MTDADPLLNALAGATPNEETEGVMPDFVRQAIVAQGLVDPDVVAATAATVDLDEDLPGDRPVQKPPEPEQEVLDLGVSIPTARSDV